MTYDLSVNKSFNVAGKSFNDNETVSAPGVIGVELLVPVAFAGTLTTRTDNSDGILTMAEAGNIQTGDFIDVYWNGGIQRDCLVGTVSGRSVPFSGGSGDALPAATTATTAAVIQVVATSMAGDDATYLLAACDNAQCVITMLQSGTEKLYLPIAQGCCYAWPAATGEVNPIAGEVIDTIHMSHANTVSPQNMRVSMQSSGLPVDDAPTAPTITSPTSASVTGTTATLGGNVTSDGGDSSTSRGVIYSTTYANAAPSGVGSSYPIPLTLGVPGCIEADTTGTTGVFTLDVTGLFPGTPYSYVAFAINAEGYVETTIGTFATTGTSPLFADLFIDTPGTGLPAHTPDIDLNNTAYDGGWNNEYHYTGGTDSNDLLIGPDGASAQSLSIASGNPCGDITDVGNFIATCTCNIQCVETGIQAGLWVNSFPNDPSVDNGSGNNDCGLYFCINLVSGKFELWTTDYNQTLTKVENSSAVVPVENTVYAFKTVSTDGGDGMSINVACYINDTLLYTYNYTPNINPDSSQNYTFSTAFGVASGVPITGGQQGLANFKNFLVVSP